MAYTAFSVTFGEQPSAAKWNTLGTNDAHFYGFLGDNEAWQPWSPTYANITVGNGTVIAEYQKVGNGVNFFYHLTCGSTTSIGSGITISLPEAAHANYNNSFSAIGTALLFDQAPAAYGGWLLINSSTTVCTVRWNDGTANISNTFPITEATGDTLSVAGNYETAA